MMIVLLASLALISGMALSVRNHVTAVILMSVFSLVCSLVFFLLHAPDVALTEATVGAGLSTFLYVWIIRRTGHGR